MRRVHDDLERKGRLDLVLMIAEGAADRFIVKLHLGEEPRLAVADHKEINLTLFLVPKIMQLESSQSQIIPTVYGLQQMASYECLGLLTRVLDRGPVPQEPLGLFSQGPGDVLDPGSDQKSKMHSAERVDPSANRID